MLERVCSSRLQSAALPRSLSVAAALAVALSLGEARAGPDGGTPSLTYAARWATAPPTVDGDVSDFAAAETLEVRVPETGAVGRFRVLWDDEALYVAFEVSDTQLNAGAGEGRAQEREAGAGMAGEGGRESRARRWTRRRRRRCGEGPHTCRKVDAIGMSIMSGAHMTLFPAVIDLLKAKQAQDIAVFGGGIVPDDDIPKLKQKGVAEIFTPGSSTQDIVTWIREHVAVRGATPLASRPAQPPPR
ncbi:MAG: sugar-binding protein [Myxococcaceae bacterium]